MRLLSLLIGFAGYLGTASAAQIVTSNLYITIADGAPIDRILTAEEMSVMGGIGATIDWGYYEGLGGGEMLIRLEPGEFVTSATIDISEGLNPPPLCNLVFATNGSEASTQLWTGLNDYRVPFFDRPGTTAPVYFQVTTNFGTFGKQFYIVPEPTSAISFCVGIAAMLSCRRRWGQ